MRAASPDHWNQQVARAVATGAARFTRPVADQFYGDRNGGITDPFGHAWFVATHKEDVSAGKLDRRAAAQLTLP